MCIRDRCSVEYFDFYLLHSLEDGKNFDTYEKYDCFQWAMAKKAAGRIRHFGFSYHGTPELLEQVLDEHPEVEFVQIQLNYADWNNQVVQSGRLYEVLRRRGIPMIVMEPVKGGMLVNLQPELEAMLRAVRPEASPASWALRFAASLEGVTTVLSGMSTPAQMAENLETFAHFEPLSERERQAIRAVVELSLIHIFRSLSDHIAAFIPPVLAPVDVLPASRHRRSLAFTLSLIHI